MTEPLTNRQADAMRFIQLCIDSEGVAPSQAEIMRALGSKSKGTPARLIDELIGRGYLKRRAAKARSISIRKRLPDELASSAAAIAMRLRLDAPKAATAAERRGMLSAAKHYSAVAAEVRQGGKKALRQRRGRGNA